MENSNPLEAHSLLNISNTYAVLPSHDIYLRNLVCAEAFFINMDQSLPAGHIQSSRSLEDILLDSKAPQLTHTYMELGNYGVKEPVSKYIFKLIASFTIRNNKKHAGMSDLKINALYSDMEYNLPWVLHILDGYGLPRTVTEDITKKIIRHTLEEYRNNMNSYILNDWSSWENLSGTLTSAPCVCSSGRDRLDIFSRGRNKQLYHKFMLDNEWSSWENMGVTIASAPAAVVTKDGISHIFALSTSGTLLYIEKKENGIFYEDIHGNMVSAPAVYLCNTGEIHIFARGIDNTLMHIARLQDGSWAEWESLGGVATSAPSVVSWDGARMEIFVRGINNSLNSISFADNRPGKWTDLGGYITSSPCASSRAYNRIDVFARGKNNQLLWKLWNGAGWSDWNDLGGFLTSRPSSVSWGPDRIDVFAKGFNNGLVYICNK